MKLKYLTRQIGQRIRQQTGLNLVVCMRAAHFIARCDNQKVREHPLTSPHVTGGEPCGDCGTSHYDLVGPKGVYGLG